MMKIKVTMLHSWTKTYSNNFIIAENIPRKFQELFLKMLSNKALEI